MKQILLKRNGKNKKKIKEEMIVRRLKLILYKFRFLFIANAERKISNRIRALHKWNSSSVCFEMVSSLLFTIFVHTFSLNYFTLWNFCFLSGSLFNYSLYNYAYFPIIFLNKICFISFEILFFFFRFLHKITIEMNVACYG